jgi:hypothetical protein
VVNTQRKIALLEEQIAIAKARPRSPENDESVQALVQMVNQMREEVIRFRAQQKRRAS